LLLSRQLQGLLEGYFALRDLVLRQQYEGAIAVQLRIPLALASARPTLLSFADFCQGFRVLALLRQGFC